MPPEVALARMADIVVITGLSGAGRSGVADVMEDLGWYVVDNLPTSLVEKVVELASLPGSSGIDRLALVAGRNHSELLQRVAAIRALGHRVTLVFLDASSNELVRRYDATTAQASAGRRCRRTARVDRARAERCCRPLGRPPTSSSTRPA